MSLYIPPASKPGRRLCVALRRRFWIRYTSQQRVRVIDCLQARTPPDAFRLEVPVPRQNLQSKTTVRVTYVPIPLVFPFISPFLIHSPFSVINPERTHDPFYIPCLCLKCSPPRPPPHPPSNTDPVNSLFSQYTSSYSPHPATDLGLGISLIFNWFALP